MLAQECMALGKPVCVYLREDLMKYIHHSEIVIGDDTKISDGVSINVTKSFVLTAFRVGKNFKIEAEIYALEKNYERENCTIGGGSCFEVQSSLEIGYWCHLGDYSFINTARPVRIGNEVGLE